MKQTIDYMNDPRMAELADEPYPVREVHAWRLKAQDAKRGMSDEQLTAYYKKSREEIDSFCDKHGIPRLKWADTVTDAK
jgi:hypothetical protein